MTYRLLCDTSSLTYRAFFALPTSITNDAGRPVNAVRGVLDMHAQLLRDHHPDEVVHVFDDDWRPAERVAAYDGYKSTRNSDPEALPWQFVLLREVLDAFGLPIAWSVGWEADDAIGALCARVGAGDRTDVVTGDRDLLQLVRDGADGSGCVRVLFTVRGVSQLATFDEAAVLAKYGVPAARYVDFATLRGDPSDGLPGVSGVGEKTARTLVAGSESLPALLKTVDQWQTGAGRDISPKLAQKLRDAKDYLLAMRAVVPVRTDVPVERFQAQRDDARLDELAAEHRLTQPVQRLRAAMGIA